MQKFQSVLAVLVLALVPAWCGAQSWQQNATDKYFDMVKSVSVDVIPGEHFQFASTTPTSALQLASGEGDAVMVDAYMEYPENVTGPLPVVVILNCGETLKEFKEIKYAKAFRAAGYATLIVNSFATRNFPGNANFKYMAYRFAPTVDAFNALAVLAKNPRIDPKRIAIVAWGNAGAVPLTIAIEDLRLKYAGAKLDYAAAIGIQPLCATTVLGKKYNKTPVLMLVAELDESTGTEVCHDAVAKATARGSVVQETVYNGAVHQWDAPMRDQHVRIAYNFSKCKWLVDLESESVTIGADVLPLTQPDLKEKTGQHLRSCFRNGARWGGDEATRSRAMTDVADFLKKNFYTKS